MSQKKPKQATQKRKKNRSRNRLPLWLALGGIALVTVAFFALQRGNTAPKATIEVTGSPNLRVYKEKIDLGDVKLGQTVQVSFQLANTGDQPLRFTEKPYIEVKEGC